MLLKRLATRPVFRQKTLSLSLFLSPPLFPLSFTLSSEKIGQWFETSKTPPIPDSFTLPTSSPPFVCLYECFSTRVPGSLTRELAGKIRSVFTQAKGEHAVRATRPKIDAHITPDIGVFLSPLDPCLRILCPALPHLSYPLSLAQAFFSALYYDNVFIGPVRTHVRRAGSVHACGTRA